MYYYKFVFPEKKRKERRHCHSLYKIEAFFFLNTHTHAHTSFKLFLHNALKMSYNKLLSEVTEDRRLFVQKVYNEMDNNAIANARGSSEDYFLQLVERN